MHTNLARRGRWALAIVAVAIVALVIGYARTGHGGSGSGSTAGSSLASAAAASSAPAAGSEFEAPGTTKGVDTQAAGTTDKAVLAGLSLDSGNVIKTADLTVAAKDVDLAAKQATQIATALGGGVSAETQRAVDPKDPATAVAELTLKVDPDNLDNALDRLAALGQERSRDSSSQDVTGQVADVNSRVTSAKASIARLQALYSKATVIGDIVNLEGQLAQREADLEALQAQQRALSAQTSYATITMSIVSSAASTVIKPPTKHHDNDLVAGLKNGWHSFTQALGWGLAGIGTLLPFVLLALLLAWIVRVVRRRGNAAPAAASGPGIVE